MRLSFGILGFEGFDGKAQSEVIAVAEELGLAERASRELVQFDEANNSEGVGFCREKYRFNTTAAIFLSCQWACFLSYLRFCLCQ